MKQKEKTQLYILSVLLFAAMMLIFNHSLLLGATIDNIPAKAEMAQKSQDLKPEEAIDINLCSLSVIECDVEAQIRYYAEKENFEWIDYLVELARCESGFNPGAIGPQKERGLFQIHPVYHPEVSDECAFDVECSTLWTIDKINLGLQGMWACDKLIK